MTPFDRRTDPARTDYPSGTWYPYPFAEVLAKGAGSFELTLELAP